MEYNVIYNDKVHKYTINIPHDLLLELRVKGKKAGFEELAPYLRAIISKEVRTGNLNLTDILGEKEVNNRIIQDIPKKIGFIRLSIKRISNIINPKQQIFNWEYRRVNATLREH